MLLAEELEKCQKLICKTVVMHYIVEKSLPSARVFAKRTIDKGYDSLSNNCMHAVSAALDGAGANYFSPELSIALGLSIIFPIPFILSFSQ